MILEVHENLRHRCQNCHFKDNYNVLGFQHLSDFEKMSPHFLWRFSTVLLGFL